MPTLNQRRDDGGWFIRYHANIDGRRSILTYQVTPGGVAKLLTHGIRAGQEFPAAILQHLRDERLVYTHGEGLSEAELPPGYSAPPIQPTAQLRNGKTLRFKPDDVLACHRSEDWGTGRVCGILEQDGSTLICIDFGDLDAERLKRFRYPGNREIEILPRTLEGQPIHSPVNSATLKGWLDSRPQCPQLRSRLKHSSWELVRTDGAGNLIFREISDRRAERHMFSVGDDIEVEFGDLKWVPWSSTGLAYLKVDFLTHEMAEVGEESEQESGSEPAPTAEDAPRGSHPVQSALPDAELSELLQRAGYRCELCDLDFLESLAAFEGHEVIHLLDPQFFPNAYFNINNAFVACQGCKRATQLMQAPWLAHSHTVAPLIPASRARMLEQLRQDVAVTFGMASRVRRFESIRNLAQHSRGIV